MSDENPHESESKMSDENPHESESESEGDVPASPYPDSATAELASTVRWWERYSELQKGMQLANQPEKLIEGVQKIEREYKRNVEKAMQSHPLWDFLKDKPGLRGPYTGWLIGRIRDPRRFPGQRCEKGHYHPDVYEVGSPCCAIIDREKETLCGSPMLPPRRGTGVRSVWHYFGLHVDEDGRRARKKKGKQASWVTEAGGIILGPFGLASQIIKHKPKPYRDIYEQHYERIKVTRGEGAETEENGESEITTGLRPFQINTRAKTIAAKAFIGDLLVEWKSYFK